MLPNPKLSELREIFDGRKRVFEDVLEHVTDMVKNEKALKKKKSQEDL
jgi:hypothetical protein